MAELIPYPFARLVRRAFRELRERGSIFDLPRRRFFLGDEGRDLSVRFHDMRAATPLGPAAGPHSQMAQNIVLAWLGGSRIIELKTVQVRDRLEIPRPCIDMHNVGYNVEWSQELRLGESLEEYAKASMLIEMLAASGELGPGVGETGMILDMSVGYDLEGIRSPSVRAFIEGMLDARDIVERLRGEIPAELGPLRDLDFTTALSRSLTLSTFHGCPPDEIERIIDYLMREHGLHCVIKLNPTLLGREAVVSILHDELGYREIQTPPEAFEKDTTWDQAVEFTGRLLETARELGLGLGVKFSNTLLVRNHRDFFPPSERAMYLSGPPLHVLAMRLVRDWRRAFGARVPISFAAGIDRRNFADSAALGLTPITVCTDLLKTGGYARQAGYLADLGARMDRAGAASIGEYVLRAHGEARPALEAAGGTWTEVHDRALGEGGSLLGLAPDGGLAERWVGEAALRNTERYVAALAGSSRYARERNTAVPKKIGSRLELFDCITCDKCIPVCPNDANFALRLPPMEIPVRTLVREDGRWRVRERGTIALEQKHQIGTFADFCNECGNCDVFCPEDGGPYIVKPRFFGSRAEFERWTAHDGFFLERDDGTGRERVLARFEGRAFRLEREGDTVRYAGEGFDVRLDLADAEATVSGEASAEIDLTYASVMDALRGVLLGPDAPVTYINA